MNIHRHGDVILKPLQAVPEGAKFVKQTHRHTLAYGEATGHHHDLAVKTSPFKVYEKDGKTYIEIESTGKLTHQEHKTQVIEPGIYEVAIKREFDYFTGELRSVRD